MPVRNRFAAAFFAIVTKTTGLFLTEFELPGTGSILPCGSVSCSWLCILISDGKADLWCVILSCEFSRENLLFLGRGTTRIYLNKCGLELMRAQRLFFIFFL